MKYLLTISIILYSFANAYAFKPYSSRPIKLGVFTSINSTKYKYTVPEHLKESNKWRNDEYSGFQFHSGIFMSYPLLNRLELNASFSSTTHGSEAEPFYNYSSLKYFYDIKYYDFTLGPKIILSRTDALDIYITPSFEYNRFREANMHIVLEGSDYFYSWTHDATNDDNYKKNTYSYNISAGLYIKPSSAKLDKFLEARYRRMIGGALNGDVKLYPYSFGIFFGLVYKI